MPGNVASAVVPVAGGNPVVFPQALSRAFTLVLAWPLRANDYHDGTSQRQALVSNDRRSWKLTQRLTASQVSTLDSFRALYPTAAFYFYDPKEVSSGQLEGSNYDVTGANTQGRFKARFVGDQEKTISIARTDTGVELIEIA